MSRKFKESFGGKGYYIALILCAAAIGISGYLYYRNANSAARLAAKTPDDTIPAAVSTPNRDVPAVATQPSAAKPQPSATKPTQGTKKLETVSPVDGETVSAYAMDSLAYNETTRDWRVHNGVDIAAEAGTYVRAAADGTVYTVYADDTMGMTVVITHDGGYTTKYSSLAENLSVAAGDTVEMGQAIGCVGQTALLESAIGDHVHFSVLRNDAPVDPAEFLA